MKKNSSFLESKKVFLCFCLFITHWLPAQISELSKLAEGKLIEYKALMDYPDLYGYFFLYEKDRISRTEYLYEYVLLDKNLNKVYSGEFKEKFYKSFADRYFLLDYSKGKLLLQIKESYSNGYGDFLYYNRFRILDVKKNKISDASYFNFKPKKETYAVTDNCYLNLFSHYFLDFFNYSSDSEGFILRGFGWPHPVCYYTSLEKNSSPLWCFKNSKKNKQNRNQYTYFSINPISNRNDIAVLEEKDIKNIKKGWDYIGKTSDIRFKIIDLKTGKPVSPILQIPDPSEKDSLINEKIKHYYLGTLNYEEGKLTRSFSDYENDQFKKYTKKYYSIETGEKIKEIFLTIDEIISYAKLNKEEIRFHSRLGLSNGNDLFIFEEFKVSQETEKSKTLEFGNFIFVEATERDLKKDLTIVKTTKTDIAKRIFFDKKDLEELKKENPENLTQSEELKDVEFTKVTNDGSVIIFYKKEIEGEAVTHLSVISYKDGKVKTLPDFPIRTSKGGKISFLAAKSGYLLLFEEFEDKDKSPELRLEKINY
ncbi:MAG: hypothetical protein LBP34_05115 [Flavobacteriaceae bacterium]|jgi:hypothetical protein|nr:hypothetical protein [Flavobacteriaceae bacterium]